jgi:hypothetical protein
MLKTTNFTIKEINYTLTHAVAAIRDITVMGEQGYAIFVIHTSRENCEKCIKGTLVPFNTVRVDFKVDRNVCDRITAYNVAKGQKIMKQFNHDTGAYEDTVVNMPFYGWEDDIV